MIHNIGDVIILSTGGGFCIQTYIINNSRKTYNEFREVYEHTARIRIYPTSRKYVIDEDMLKCYSDFIDDSDSQEIKRYDSVIRAIFEFERKYDSA
jgi:hypothetical protein